MLMHQCLGLDTFNYLPRRHAVHALYECCCSVIWSTRIAEERPYPDRAALLDVAEEELFDLSEADIDRALTCHGRVAQRSLRQSSIKPRSIHEQCAIDVPAGPLLQRIAELSAQYEERFGYRFLVSAEGSTAEQVATAISDRLHHDPETERKVLRIELARITRRRIEDMLGPEGGYDPYYWE